MKIKISSLLKKPTTPLERFHALTKNDYVKINKIPLPSKAWIKKLRKKIFKSYPRLPIVYLTKEKLSAGISLFKTIVQRKSDRQFTKKFISKKLISKLLLYGCGLRYYNNAFENNRYYPSAGGRYPLEIYLLSFNTGLKSGLYHYGVKNHLVEKLISFDKLNHEKYFKEKIISKSSFIIIITAVFKRTVIKYGNRGYRYIMFEAGHVCQNLLLLATALNIKSCPIGGFDDYNLDELLDLDSVNESVIYTVAFS